LTSDDVASLAPRYVRSRIIAIAVIAILLANETADTYGALEWFVIIINHDRCNDIALKYIFRSRKVYSLICLLIIIKKKKTNKSKLSEAYCRANLSRQGEK